MKKKTFRIITQTDYDFIPDDTVVIHDESGLVYMSKKNKAWFTNSKSFNKEEAKKFKKDEVAVLKEFSLMLEAELNNIQ